METLGKVISVDTYMDTKEKEEQKKVIVLSRLPIDLIGAEGGDLNPQRTYIPRDTGSVVKEIKTNTRHPLASLQPSAVSELQS
jgi:hypothetical protein